MPVTWVTVSLVTLAIVFIVYLIDSLYARRWLTIQKDALSYVSAAVLIGVFGEVFVETIYATVFGQPLWHYQFLPVHDTFTSLLSYIMGDVRPAYLLGKAGSRQTV